MMVRTWLEFACLLLLLLLLLFLLDSGTEMLWRSPEHVGGRLGGGIQHGRHLRQSGLGWVCWRPAQLSGAFW